MIYWVCGIWLSFAHEADTDCDWFRRIGGFVMGEELDSRCGLISVSGSPSPLPNGCIVGWVHLFLFKWKGRVMSHNEALVLFWLMGLMVGVSGAMVVRGLLLK